MYKTEATLGLIGAILTCIAVVLLLVVGILVGVVFNAAANAVSDGMDEFIAEYGDAQTQVEYQTARTAVGATIGVLIGGLVLLVASVVLGFMGWAKLRAEKKLGGILLIIAGVLSFVSLFLGGWWGIVSMVLFLVGGIMAVVKKPQAPAEA